MAIQNITTWANPYDPATPLTNVYAYAAGLGLDASNGSGQVTYNAHPNANAWTGTPIGQVSIQLGDVIVPVNGEIPAVVMPTLAELMANPQFAQAYTTIGQVLDAYAVQHPAFAGGSVTGAA